MNTPILLNNWLGGTVEDVFQDFDSYQAYWNDDVEQTPVMEKDEFKNVEILLASYGTPSYEGYAFVLFRENDKLYEVNASHCSCYGLEGQWEPEETTIESLKHRIGEGNLGEGGWDENPFAEELLTLLETLC